MNRTSSAFPSTIDAKGEVLSVAISLTGDHLAAACADKTVSLSRSSDRHFVGA
jgi:hypothetical protein